MLTRIEDSAHNLLMRYTFRLCKKKKAEKYMKMREEIIFFNRMGI